jgi:ATP-dependent protease HslVU (ClpYQ) peptidase subunit
MAPIFPAISALAAALLPASKTLAGFAATAAHSSGGLLHALQDKLRAWEDKEFALKEKVAAPSSSTETIRIPVAFLPTFRS